MDSTTNTQQPSETKDALPGGATRVIGRWAASITSSSLPSHVAHHGRRMIVDYLAASVAGSTNPLSQRLRDFMAESEPGTRASAIRGARMTASAAAYTNGVAAHGLELDDGYTPGSVHPGAAVIPAVLAVAEATRASIDDAARAVAVAVEVTSRIAAAGHPAVLNAGFHNTGVTGVFGAAAGVVNLLGGNEQQYCDALGLAGSHAGALREYHTAASEVKRLHAGKAARDGVVCGEMAMSGISGPDTVLEGPNGYFAAFARGDWKPDMLLGRLGEDWVCTRTYIKPYPCCRHLHGPIDAALALRETGQFDIDDIESVEVSTFEIATRLRRAPASTLLEAQFSIPFAVAAALRLGSVTLDSFRPECIADARIQQLAARVSIVADANATAAYPQERPATVTVTARNGRTFAHHVSQPLGEPGNPIDDDALSAKFESLVFPIMGESLGSQMLNAAWRGNDITEITAALGA